MSESLSQRPLDRGEIAERMESLRARFDEFRGRL